MVNWKASLESRVIGSSEEWAMAVTPSLEGKHLDKLKRKTSNILGIGKQKRITELNKNLTKVFPVKHLTTVDNTSHLKGYYTYLTSKGITEVSMGNIAKAYLVGVAFNNDNRFLMSLLCGDTYPTVSKIGNKYLPIIYRITITEDPATNPKEIDKRLKDIGSCLDYGEIAIKQIGVVYDNVKTYEIKQVTDTIKYEVVIEELHQLMLTCSQLTAESTHDGPKILLLDILERIKGNNDTTTENKVSVLLPRATQLLDDSKRVDIVTEELWSEWDKTNDTQLKIADLYIELNDITDSN